MSSFGPLPPGYSEVGGKVHDATGRRITATELRQLLARREGVDTNASKAWKRGSKGAQHREREAQWGGRSASGTGGAAPSGWSWGASGTGRSSSSSTGDGDGWKIAEWGGTRYRIHYETGWYEVVQEEEEEDGEGEGAAGTGAKEEEEGEAEEEDAVGAPGTEDE
jgi:hypothetical protein